MSRICIGTANFGLAYGINNFSGKITSLELDKIFKVCKKYSIVNFDTASSYGDAERRIGTQITKSNIITTKLSAVQILDLNNDGIPKAFSESLGYLRRSRVANLLVHDGHQINLEQYKEIQLICERLKDKRVIEKWGLSLYSPAPLSELWPHRLPDLLQIPVNIFDQRFEKQGWSEKLSSSNVEMHGRSIFLQGLLVANPKSLPNAIYQKCRTEFNEWKSICTEFNVSPQSLAFSYALSREWLSKIVVGVDTSFQLEELAKLEKKPLEIPDTIRKLSIENEDVILPFRWNL